jgi:hypothetical protein
MEWEEPSAGELRIGDAAVLLRIQEEAKSHHLYTAAPKMVARGGREGVARPNQAPGEGEAGDLLSLYPGHHIGPGAKRGLSLSCACRGLYRPIKPISARHHPTTPRPPDGAECGKRSPDAEETADSPAAVKQQYYHSARKARVALVANLAFIPLWARVRASSTLSEQA